MTAAAVETPRRPTTSWTMPDGLTADEAIAYRKGYNRGCKAYIKLHGNGAVVNTRPFNEMTDLERRFLSRALAGTMVAHHEARHPTAHKAGMSSLKSWVRKYNAAPRERLAEIIDPLNPSLSKNAA
jgi:hypothetical protein